VSTGVDAIARVVGEIEAAFNAKDAERAVSQYAAEASMVGVDGALVSGRDALLAAHRAAYAGPARDQYARHELADATFIRPDVAVAHVRARAVNANGEPLDVGHTLLALYVLVREDGRWLVAARHDTVVR
jgi:uncharacterized protein (TIGR02246 family)